MVAFADIQIPFGREEGLVASEHSIVLSEDVPVFLLEQFPSKKPIGMNEPVSIELVSLALAVVVGVMDLLAILAAIDRDNERIPRP